MLLGFWPFILILAYLNCKFSVLLWFRSPRVQFVTSATIVNPRISLYAAIFVRTCGCILIVWILLWTRGLVIAARISALCISVSIELELLEVSVHNNVMICGWCIRWCWIHISWFVSLCSWEIWLQMNCQS